ncbi:smr family protein [Penicillium lagena]|uniref:smr family protein n=1 Tax=Penicillium lagena TaxID=94218 RepID=UPI002541074C|nr:smr family protein [Penicillium lagena]KAJ5618899.1 smr family protein [Penicillium lagena]
MSHEMAYMGPRAFNHEQSSDAEAEYDRLRGLARQEASKRNACFQRSQEAYSSGDGAGAKHLSEEGKAHGHKMDEYNKQASEFIFRENNASGRVAADTIDLHGQFVEEAEEILEERIRYAKTHGQNHLHVIVGKGNHSANHVQKIKPRVEQVCRELGLQYSTEENAGRMYINLTGGAAVMPPPSSHQHQPSHHQYPGQPHQPHQQPQQQDEVEQVVKAVLPKVMRKLEKACCVVM